MPPNEGHGALDTLSTPATVQEAARSHRATHGRGTSRWIAQEYGVSQRTAQRWLAGTQQPRDRSTRDALMAAADEQQVRIDALRKVHAVDLGTVAVYEGSPNIRSERDLGYIDVDLSPVADLLEAGGSEAEAEDLANRIYLGQYFNADADSDFPIEITDLGDVEYY